jgi:hypothetical protein
MRQTIHYLIAAPYGACIRSAHGGARIFHLAFGTTLKAQYGWQIAHARSKNALILDLGAEMVKEFNGASERISEVSAVQEGKVRAGCSYSWTRQQS